MSFTDWENTLCHYGLKGQKWGIRRFQNQDGSLTPEGRARYGQGGSANAKQRARFLNKLDQQRAHAAVKENEQRRRRGEAGLYKANQYRNTQERTLRTINKVLSAAKNDHISINSESTRRLVTTGRTVVKSIAMTAAVSTLLTAGSGLSAFGRAAAKAAASPIGIGAATANAYFVPTISYKTTTGTKYKAKRN